MSEYRGIGKEIDYDKLKLGQLVKADLEVVDSEWGVPNVRAYFRSRVTGCSRSGESGELRLTEVRFENGVILWGSFGHGVKLYRTSKPR